MSAKIEATIEDLYHVLEHGNAELVNGEIILMPATGDMPSRAGLSIVISLRQQEGKQPGRAYPDNAGFLVHLPNRRSFSPDAAWHVGPSTGMKFLEGAPVFAVEVRSEDDSVQALNERWPGNAQIISRQALWWFVTLTC